MKQTQCVNLIDITIISLPSSFLLFAQIGCHISGLDHTFPWSSRNTARLVKCSPRMRRPLGRYNSDVVGAGMVNKAVPVLVAQGLKAVGTRLLLHH